MWSKTGRRKNVARSKSLREQPVSGTPSFKIQLRKPVGDPRRKAPHPVVLPVAAYAGDEWRRGNARRQRVEKPRYIRRIVLPVPVEGRDQGPPSLPDARYDCRTLSAASAQAHDPQPDAARLRFGKALPRLVAASIVDINDLIGQSGARKRRFGLGDQRQDILGLVKNRDDNREGRRVGHRTSDNKTAAAHP